MPAPAPLPDAPASRPAHLVGIVVIGRNEGERLRRCLESVAAAAPRIVYVDSGSTDGSAAMARARGVDVVELDMSRPFTAAWARNSGWRRLLARFPDTTLVHFIDGDCEIMAGWLDEARGFLEARPDVAVVCGRRRERHPEATVFNRQCEIEWNAPVGEVRSCGGDALMRADALRAVDGYRDGLIAGEEPELCVRLRARGWKVWRLARDMAWHDAAMTRWAQWWRRTMRAGHAYAEGAALHGAPPERHCVRETRRALAWGLALPAAILAVAVVQPWCLAVFLLYLVQFLRLALRPTPAAREAGAPWSRAFFLVAGRFPEAAGVLLYRWRRLNGRDGTLIEYK